MNILHYLIKNKKIVVAKLPVAGLGNKLTVWALAYIYSLQHNLPFFITGWSQLSLGPWLRREKKKRLYWRQFKEISFVERLILNQHLLFRSVYQFLNRSRTNEITSNIILLEKYEMSFAGIFEYRQYIIDAFYDILDVSVKKDLDSLDSPQVAVHIRRGDFKLTNNLTPLNYYKSAILEIRKITGKDLPVTIYSDASENELTELFQIPQVKMSITKSDVLDLIEMSRAKILITSANSTFSYWAVFLGESVAIKYTNEWFPALRNTQIGSISNEWVYHGRESFSDELKLAVIKKFTADFDI